MFPPLFSGRTRRFDADATHRHGRGEAGVPQEAPRLRRRGREALPALRRRGDRAAEPRERSAPRRGGTAPREARGVPRAGAHAPGNPRERAADGGTDEGALAARERPPHQGSENQGGASPRASPGPAPPDRVRGRADEARARRVRGPAAERDRGAPRAPRPEETGEGRARQPAVPAPPQHDRSRMIEADLAV